MAHTSAVDIMNHEVIDELHEILYLTLENAASLSQVQHLNQWMASDVEVKRYIDEYYMMAAALRKVASTDLSNSPK